MGKSTANTPPDYRIGLDVHYGKTGVSVMLLESKTAIITGAERGIGFATAKRATLSEAAMKIRSYIFELAARRSYKDER